MNESRTNIMLNVTTLFTFQIESPKHTRKDENEMKCQNHIQH